MCPARPSLTLRLAIAMAASVTCATGHAAWPNSEDPHLAAGRSVWIAVCRECHGSTLSDAPHARDATAWAPRIAKGRDVLYRHAIEGFQGPTGTEMPPRGATPGLTDEEVRAAVDYMLFVVDTLSEQSTHP